MPERASASTAKEPTPPTPTTVTWAHLSLLSASLPMSRSKRSSRSDSADFGLPPSAVSVMGSGLLSPSQTALDGAQNLAEHGQPEADIVMYGIITCWFVFTFILSRAVSLICACSAGVHASAGIRRQLTEHVGRLPVIFTEKFGAERLKGLIMEASETAEKYLSKALPDFAFAAALPFTLTVVMLIFDLRFGLICLLPLAAGMVTALLMSGRTAVKSISNHRKLFTILVLCGSSFFAFIILTALILSQGTGITAEQSAELAANVVFYGIYTPMMYTALMKLSDAKASCSAARAAADSIDIISEIEPLPEAENDKTPEDFSIFIKKKVLWKYKYIKTENDC